MSYPAHTDALPSPRRLRRLHVALCRGLSGLATGLLICAIGLHAEVNTAYCSTNSAVDAGMRCGDLAQRRKRSDSIEREGGEQ